MIALILDLNFESVRLFLVSFEPHHLFTLSMASLFLFLFEENTQMLTVLGFDSDFTYAMIKAH